jgi:Double zinc ribbon
MCNRRPRFQGFIWNRGPDQHCPSALPTLPITPRCRFRWQRRNHVMRGIGSCVVEPVSPDFHAALQAEPPAHPQGGPCRSGSASSGHGPHSWRLVDDSELCDAQPSAVAVEVQGLRCGGVMPDQEDAPDREGVRLCPFCKEEIKSDAVKCKHCGSRVTPERPAHGGICPYCKEEINPEATKCKHCKSTLNTDDGGDCGCQGGQGEAYARPPSLQLRRGVDNERALWTWRMVGPGDIPGGSPFYMTTRPELGFLPSGGGLWNALMSPGVKLNCLEGCIDFPWGRTCGYYNCHTVEQ